jgi:outer membrane protein TolC
MINLKKLAVASLMLTVLVAESKAQKANQLTLSEAHELAMKQYPLTKQRDLITKTADYTIENIEKGYWPQININAQASYQSDVTQLPIAMPGVKPLSKDQYKAYADINQLIYDGGVINQQKELQKANAAIEQTKLESSLYQLKERINQLYFGALLIDEQIRQNNLLLSDIELGLKKVEALIANGTALKSSGDVLSADLLRNKQRIIELRNARKAFTNMLSLFVGKEISDQTVLIQPQAIVPIKQINRAELQTYREQGKVLDVQNRMLVTKTLPKVSLFLQSGLGRPALNMLSNSFEGYYIGGLRLTWSPSIFYTLKKERELIDLNRNSIDVQKETFLFNTSLILSQQETELNKYRELLQSDEEIIMLRTRIKTASIAQLENGVINSNDYLREANAENQARQNQAIHQLQTIICTI